MHGIKNTSFFPRRDTAASLCLILLSLLVIGITVLPFLILCRYNHPGDNDNWWIFRTFLDKKGPTITLATLFSLRGTFNFANLFFFPLYNHPEGMTEELFATFLSTYHLSAAFYVLLFWLAASVLYVSLNRSVFHFKGSRSFFLYALFLYLLFNAVHHPTMAFYDLVSSSGYNAGLSYLFFFISFSLLHYVSEGKRRIPYGIACVLFFMACIFSMEYYPFVCGCISFAIILYDACGKRRPNIMHALFLVICIAVFFRNFYVVRKLVMPDVDGYVGKYTGGSDSGITLAMTLGSMLQSLRENGIRYFRQLITRRCYLPVTALLAVSAARKLHRNGMKLPLWAVLPFFLIILGICAIFSFSTPDLFVMPRYAWTPFVLLFLFILALLVSIALLLLQAFDRALAADRTGDFLQVREGFAAVRRICRNRAQDTRKLLACTAACMLLFSWCALKDANTCVATAWKDILKGEAAAFDQEMTDRYAAIFAAEQGEAVYLVPILHRPKSLFVRDSMEFETDRVTVRQFFDNDGIYFKVGELILR